MGDTLLKEDWGSAYLAIKLAKLRDVPSNKKPGATWLLALTSFLLNLIWLK